MRYSRLADNISTVLSRPKLGLLYLQYQLSRWRHGGSAILKYSNFKLKGFNGFSEYHSTRQGIEDNEYLFLVKFSFPSGIMLDVGANLGLVSLLLAQQYPDRRIISFEPNPSTHAACEINFQMNEAKNITLEQSAVGDTNGMVHFNTSPQSRATAHIAADSTGQEVRCTTLDAYAARSEIEPVALLKVDVEGYEEAVFAGAQDLLPKVAVVYFEVCPSNARAAGLDPTRPAHQLLDAGFKLYRIVEGGGLRAADPRAIKDVRLENWVAHRL